MYSALSSTRSSTSSSRSGIEAKSRLEKLYRDPVQQAAIRLASLIVAVITLLYLVSRGNRVVSSNDMSMMKSIHDQIYTDEDAPYLIEPVKDYRERLTRQLALVEPGTIFVSLASFRDDDCPGTLEMIFSKAARPDKVFVGLVDQTKWDEGSGDFLCDLILTLEQRKRVRIVRMPSKNAKGPTHARYLASKLWLNEEYYLQIDAHSTFIQDWDLLAIKMLNSMPHQPKVALSHYPPGTPEELNAQSAVTWICEGKDHEQAPKGLFVQSQNVCLEANGSPEIQVPGYETRPVCASAFMGGGLFFARSTFLLDAPLDPHLDYIFHGEEVLIAARLWTSGWNIYTPAVNLVSHVYGGRTKNVHSEQTSEDWRIVHDRSAARARLLLNAALPDDTVDITEMAEIDDLGMGKQRSLKDYMKFAGLEGMSKREFISRCDQRFENDDHWVPKSDPVGSTNVV